ncbi:MAG: 23S rRNA (guanosine(2251)-2'-O)-methyltransferase RlmB [Patescibacteria group bacterium]
MKQKRIYIYGKHSVHEALLHAPHIINTIYLSPQMEVKEILSLISRNKIKTEKIDPQKVSSWVEGGASHQGVIALINTSGLTMPFEKFMQTFKPEGMLVYLDGIQDPHNMGTIIRASAAFGASAVLFPQHGASPVTGAVVKTSAGAAFALPLVGVENPQQALAELKRKGVKIYGLAGEGASNIAEEKFDMPTLLVLGNEAEGVSPSARALCEKMLNIPISKRVESLNVASAATAALFAWSQKHPLH